MSLKTNSELESKIELKSRSKSQDQGRKQRRGRSMARFRAVNHGCLTSFFLGSLVVIASLTSASVTHNHSVNNRGGWRKSLADFERSPSKFGERTKSLDRREDGKSPAASPIVWSQPDPRKSYSLPLTKALHTRRQVVASTNHQLSSNKPEKQPSPTGSISSTVKPPNLVLEAGRRNAAPPLAGETVTLIRYVPFLMQLPADQLLQLASSSAQQRQIKQPDQPEPPGYLLSTPPSLASHLPPPVTYPYTPPIVHSHHHHHQRAPLETPQQPLYEFQQDASSYLMGGYPTTSTAELAFGPNTNAVRLAYLPASALQPPSSLSAMSGKALSAYASRLISMLRPSALLNSFGGSVGHHNHQLQPLYNSPIPQGPFILLAPTTTAAIQQLPSERPRPVQRFNQKPVAQELLLDQASYRSTASRLQPAWAHQHPNGLLCVHSLSLVSPSHQPQVTTDDSSFDYVPGNELGAGGPGAEKDNDDSFSPTTKTFLSPKSSQSSPPKLSKVTNGKLATSVNSTNKQLVASKLGLSNSSANDEQHGRRLGDHQPMIPFTIKDKIEAPQQLRDRHQSTYSPSSGVHFDEPADTPDEEPGGRGRPSKTSFSAATAITTLNPPSMGSNSKKQASSAKLMKAPSPNSGREPSVHSAIDYSRELGAQAGSLPLLIATSNRNRGAHSGPLASTTTSSATSAEMEAASQVSTRSSLDNSTNSSNISTSVVVASGGELGLEEGGHSYSNNRLLSNLDNSMEEFARMSEQLQTNPMDLIDLQNARSNFELPAQLESLSMLYNSQQVLLGSPGAQAADSDSLGDKQRTQLGQLRWTVGTTPATLAAPKHTRIKSRS